MVVRNKETIRGGDVVEVLPETKALLYMVAAQEGPQLHKMHPASARAAMARMADMFDLPSIDVKEVRNLLIPAPAGDIPARLHVPISGQEDGPVLVYFHGGGWVLGGADGCDSACRHMAERLGFRVLSIGYRMAPEHVFPAAFDDRLAATNWAAGSPSALGANVTHVIVSGDSAGGNLAAAVSGSGRAKLAAQLLFYPVTDISQQSGSYAEFAEGYLLQRVGMEWFRDHYLPEVSMRKDIRVSPLPADDLSMVPPTVIVACGLDVPRDEGRAYAYAAKVCLQGIRVRFSEAAGQIHGIVNLRKALPTGGAVVDRMLDDLADMPREIGVIA
jgi:acetyl esterase